MLAEKLLMRSTTSGQIWFAIKNLFTGYITTRVSFMIEPIIRPVVEGDDIDIDSSMSN